MGNTAGIKVDFAWREGGYLEMGVESVLSSHKSHCSNLVRSIKQQFTFSFERDLRRRVCGF